MNKVDYSFEWYVEKTKSILSKTLSKGEKIDQIKIQLFMKRHQMPAGYNRAMKMYERLCNDGFLIRDTKNLGAYINREGGKE